MPKPPLDEDTPLSPARPRRGRPPKQEGRIPKAEVQRAYRERQKAAGKIVRTVDAATLTAVQVGVPAIVPYPGIPAFDPKTQVIIEQDFFQGLQEQLRHALSKFELCEASVAQLR